MFFLLLYCVFRVFLSCFYWFFRGCFTVFLLQPLLKTCGGRTRVYGSRRLCSGGETVAKCFFFYFTVFLGCFDRVFTFFFAGVLRCFFCNHS